MIPLRDSIGRRGATPVVWGLAAVWIAAYVLSVRMSDVSLAHLHELCGLDPGAWWRAFDVAVGRRAGPRLPAIGRVLLPLVAHKLLHGGVLQLLANSVFFLVFAGRLEARAGALRFLLFHELAGALAALALLWWGGEPRSLAIGASGAVAASISAYCVLYLRSRVVVVVPVVIVPVFLEVPAVVLALAWAVFQIRPIARLLEIGPAVPVAWPADVGGAAAGLLLLPLVLRTKRRGRRR